MAALDSNAALTFACRKIRTSVESGFLIDGSSGASRGEGLALEAVEGYGNTGGGEHGIGGEVPQEEQDGGCCFLGVAGDVLEKNKEFWLIWEFSHMR